jgi:HSP20 family protein
MTQLVRNNLFGANLWADFMDWGNIPQVTRNMYRCPMSVTNSDADGYTISIDLPGVPREALKVNTENGVLKVSWTRDYQKFEKSWDIPRYVSPQKITAKLADGVLTLRLPRRESSKVLEIPIQ